MGMIDVPAFGMKKQKVKGGYVILDLPVFLLPGHEVANCYFPQEM